MGKKNKFEDSKLLFGILIGLLGGFVTNILVSSMYRLLDERNLSGHNGLTFVVAAIGTTILVAFFYHHFTKSLRKMK